MLRSEGKGFGGAAFYKLELGPWPTGELGAEWGGYGGGAAWPGQEESTAAVVGGVEGRLKIGTASSGAALAAAAVNNGAIGPVSCLPQGGVDGSWAGKATYWKTAATHLKLEVLEGSWLSGGWGEGGLHERESEEEAERRILKTIDVYPEHREFSMHADTGCPAIAYPSDKVGLFEPYLHLGQGSRPENTTLAMSFRVQPDDGGPTQVVRVPMPNPSYELSVRHNPTQPTVSCADEGAGWQGMMGPPPDEYTKPYWVFGLPIWRSAPPSVFFCTSLSASAP